MVITRQIEQLVDWAERAMMEAEFDPVDHDTLRELRAASDSPG